ncbi:hypothetical protein Hypma_002359 [Hypsizygus marmoreus]|uniref:Uncharacterized protein n=1 Tax=Hypsizygus marmoreus TaxID=39966 RepID=A0A369JD95_HYPMA|nr:hypothetical protein Hypma_002359 [Hypsizygus marmoreus]
MSSRVPTSQAPPSLVTRNLYQRPWQDQRALVPSPPTSIAVVSRFQVIATIYASTKALKDVR